MKAISYIILSILIAGTASAKVEINVIYPAADQQIPLVKSMFIFGNATEGAELTVNGFPIEVHEDGGWLAYIPVEPGCYEFNIFAYKDNDTSFFKLPVQIGPVDLIETSFRPLIPNTPYPDTNVIYSAGDIFEFSFKAPPDGTGWFKVGKSTPNRMYAAPEISNGSSGSVFGEIPEHTFIQSNYITYKGNYILKPDDVDLHAIEYWYETGDFLRTRHLYTDSILQVIDRYPPLVGKLIGTSNIIRTGIGKGYKLLYLPPGIKVVITGAENEYYRIRLGEGIAGYANIDSVEVLPAGTPAPSGEVSFITVNETVDDIEIACEVGQKLPYEITESISKLSIDIDIFGATGDVDWIRYNTFSELIKLVKWSQPSDDIFRISIEFDDKFCAGYSARYDESRLIFNIKKNPGLRRWPRKPLGGLKITVDPGHSHDSGAIGPTGLKEKDANLWIAHKLRKMLLRNGAEVLMTRYGHEHTPLYDRPRMALEWDADILVSIHNNALPDGVNPFNNNGVSVYYYHPHSKALAESIHKQMIRRTGLPDHGLYYGNLVLTRPTEIPSVLVECAFMMIPEQEAMLKTDSYQRKCARAILDGIKNYLKQGGRR